MKTAIRHLMIFLLAATVAGHALADRGRGRPHRTGVGVGIVVAPYMSPYAVPYGNPWWPHRHPYWYGPAPYPYPYPSSYHYPPVIIERVSPPVYIEQPTMSPPVAVTPPATGFWYYCPPAQAYYPTVKECPSGWHKVPPTPPQ